MYIQATDPWINSSPLHPINRLAKATEEELTEWQKQEEADKEAVGTRGKRQFCFEGSRQRGTPSRSGRSEESVPNMYPNAQVTGRLVPQSFIYIQAI